MCPIAMASWKKMLKAPFQQGALISTCVSVLRVYRFLGAAQHCDPNRGASRQQELAVCCKRQRPTQDNEQTLLKVTTLGEDSCGCRFPMSVLIKSGIDLQPPWGCLLASTVAAWRFLHTTHKFQEPGVYMSSILNFISTKAFDSSPRLTFGLAEPPHYLKSGYKTLHRQCAAGFSQD